MNELFVALLLGGAACMDLIDKKIKNIWLLFWLGTGVVYNGPKFFIAVIISFIPLFLRLCYFFSFLKITIQTKKIGHYYEVGRDDPQLSIAMAPWFLCGFFVWRLIKIWMII